MTKKRISSTLFVGLLFVLGVSIFFTQKTYASNIKFTNVDIPNNLKKHFSDKANNLTINYRDERLNNKEVLTYENNGNEFKVDKSNGNLISYINIKFDEHPAKKISKVQAKQAVLEKLKELYPEKDLSTLKLTKEDLQDNNSNKEYVFEWSKSSNDLLAEFLTVKTTEAGEITSIGNFDWKDGAATSDTKITKEEAIKTVVDKLKSTLKTESSNRLKVDDVRKLSIDNTLVWVVEVEWPYPDKELKTPILKAFFVNAITGEIEEH